MPRPKLLACKPAEVTHELYRVVGLEDGKSVAFVVVESTKSEEEAAFKENLDCFLFCLLLLCFEEEREEKEVVLEEREDICFVEFVVLFFTISGGKIDCFFCRLRTYDMNCWDTSIEEKTVFVSNFRLSALLLLNQYSD